ncbi:MAG: hypothetical protein ACP5T4_01330 [Candidatus Micrarchaeia archaeon]
MFPNAAFISEFAKLVKETREKLAVVTGGGAIAKAYVNSLKPEVANEFWLDTIGMKATEMNALALVGIMKANGVDAAFSGSIAHVEDALRLHNVAVTAGQIPGITTDTVAVLACEALGVNTLVNVSSVGYVYDRPPESKEAKRLRKISHGELLELASKYDTREAKSAFVFDMLACKLAKRSNIEIRFVDSSIKNIRNALTDRKFEGTLVKD